MGSHARDDSALYQRYKYTMKETRTRAQRQQQGEEEGEEAKTTEMEHEDTEGEQHTGTFKGAKRRRINRDGDSVPSRAASQEVDEDTERSSQAKDVRFPEFKTLPRDTDGYVFSQVLMIGSDC